MYSWYAAQDWIDSISPAPCGVAMASCIFAEDRDLSSQAFRNAIINSNHRGEDIAIALNMPLQNTLLDPVRPNPHGQPANGLRSYLNYLLMESRLLGGLIDRKRQVSSLHWPAHMTKLLHPAEMTEVMYSLNRNFGMRHDDSGHYVFELDRKPADDGFIALIRGLGFTELYLDDFSQNFGRMSAQELNNFVYLARRYGFRAIGARLHCHPDSDLASMERIVRGLLSMQVEFISLCTQEHRLDGLSPLYEPGKVSTHNPLRLQLAAMLIEQGYHNDSGFRFVSAQAPQWPSPTQVYGLGLGALSISDNLFAINVDQLDRYYALLDQQQLPFCHGGYVRHTN